MALPTFFIVGAAKAGTTSLHRYLSEHPEISMSSEKEPMLFEKVNWLERIAEYKDLFDPDARVRGEASTAYAAYPWVPEIPDRIQALIPDARIIYCVRDPIARMVAHYAQFVWDEFPVRPWDELMDDLEDPMNMPVWISRYATQYERWAERFAAERVLVVEQRDLLYDRGPTLRRVFEFLEVDPGFVSPNWDETHNRATDHRVPTDLALRLGPRADRFEDTRFARPLLSKPVPKPHLTRRQRKRVVALLKPEAERLHEMTGVSIGHWRF